MFRILRVGAPDGKSPVKSSRGLRVAGIITAMLALLILLWNYSGSPSALSKSTSPKSKFAEAIRTINAPFIYPISAPYYVSQAGVNFTMKGPPIWTEPLGDDLCILDIDSRPFSKENELFNDDHPLRWDSFDKFSAALLNHHLYATIHGYRYTFIQIPAGPSDRYISWAKIPAMIDHLKTCKHMLVIEADGLFSDLTLPMEWQMNYWNFTKDTKVAIPADPDDPINLDSRGNVNLNTGFVLAQSTPRTMEIWSAWGSCPDDHDRFPGCQKWAKNWPCEQGAYSDIIRYHFNKPNDLLILPCDEANGYPEADYACKGTLNFQHYWIKKSLVKEKSVPPIMQSVMQGLQLDFLMSQDKIVQRPRK